MVTVALIGLSLSLDAFAVSVSAGITGGLRKLHALRASFFFGLFQFLMPVAGWFLGATVVSYIEAFDHWMAFILLAGIGAKMIFDGLKAAAHSPAPDIPRPGKSETAAKAGETNPLAGIKTLLLLAVATSIDALAVGLSLNILGQKIFSAAALIGLITFTVCLAGFLIGKRAGHVFGKGLRIAGGLVLIGIGVKIVAEHLIA
jgi:putative Mn2+ efflux pump MntP